VEALRGGVRAGLAPPGSASAALRLGAALDDRVARGRRERRWRGRIASSEGGQPSRATIRRVSAAGRSKPAVVPPSGRGSRLSRPPCAATIRRQRINPRPVPERPRSPVPSRTCRACAREAIDRAPPSRSADQVTISPSTLKASTFSVSMWTSPRPPSVGRSSRAPTRGDEPAEAGETRALVAALSGLERSTRTASSQAAIRRLRPDQARSGLSSGGGGIRTLDTPKDVYRFSRPAHST
jgi:hypothetical protein